MRIAHLCLRCGGELQTFYRIPGPRSRASNACGISRALTPVLSLHKFILKVDG